MAAPVSPVAPGIDVPEEYKVVFRSGDPEVLDLPAVAYYDREGTIVTRWKLTWRERLSVLFRGSVWIAIKTFGDSLQPIAFIPRLTESDVPRKAGGNVEETLP